MQTINILEFLATQHTERYRAFVIWDEAMTGKTDFARRLAKATGGYYLDLLSHFTATPTLKEKIDLFGPTELRGFLLNTKPESAFVVVDNLDFLLNTWSTTQKREFFAIVDKIDSAQTNKTFCFVLQRDDVLFERRLLNTQGDERVIHLRQILEL